MGRSWDALGEAPLLMESYHKLTPRAAPELDPGVTTIHVTKFSDSRVSVALPLMANDAGQ